MVEIIKIFSLCIFFIFAAASAPSFCKCTCFANSTIIPLSTHPQSQTSDKSEPRAPLVGCATCNKAFCLSQRLPICKDAEEKDTITACFQRDSQRDKIVVLTFIAGTLGLLSWAGLKRLVKIRKGRSHIQHDYLPVNTH